MHGLRYLWLIGDGHSSVYHSGVTGVPSYGHEITKVEFANHAVKCYWNRLEALYNDKPLYHCTHELSKGIMKRITHGTRCAIKMHSGTSNVAAPHHDLRNSPHHYFGLLINVTQPFASRCPKSLHVKLCSMLVLTFVIAYQSQDNHLLTNCLLISFVMLRQQETGWCPKQLNSYNTNHQHY